MKYVIVEGASTAYGYGAESSGGWANLLKEDRAVNMAYEANPEIVLNVALPGSTIGGINKRFDAVTGIASQSDDMVRILGVGLNEAKVFEGDTKQPVSSEQFRDHIGSYTEKCRNIGAKVILMGVQPINERLTNPMQITQSTLSNADIFKYDQVLREQAKEAGAKYVDVSTQFGTSEYPKSEHISADGYHPSELGHRIIHRALQKPLDILGFISSQPDLTPIR